MRLLMPMLIAAVLMPMPAQAQQSSDSLPLLTPVVHRGLQYAVYDTRTLHLDLYLPQIMDSPPPLIVLVTGGGWDNGSKDVVAPQAEALAARGLAVAAIDYRGPVEQIFPTTVHDVKAAVRWAKANADNYGLNADAIGVMGFSFGGQLAAYVAVTPHIVELEGNGGNADKSSAVYAAVGFSTLTELLELPGRAKGIMKDFLGGWHYFNRKLWRFASPIEHVSVSSPPLLLIAGATDGMVPPSQSTAMAEAYLIAGAEAEVHVLPGAHHAFWNMEEWEEKVMDMTAKFFLDHAGKR